GAAPGQVAQEGSGQRRPAKRTGTIETAPAPRRRGGGLRAGGQAPRPPSSEGKPEMNLNMNLDTLTNTCGEWLRGTGPEADIVIPSRIRLARNLAAFPFTSRASAHQKAEIEILLRERLSQLDLSPPLGYVHLPNLSPLDRQFLVERQLISR